MSFKVIAAIFLCGMCACSANPVPGNTVSTTPDPNNKIYLPDTLDDKANWEEVWKVANESKNASVGRSGDTDENVFDIIMGINAKERGSGIGRADTDAFLFEGDIEMSKSDAIKIIKGGDGTSRGRRAIINNRNKKWIKNNIAYSIDNSLHQVRNNVLGGIREWQRTLYCMGTWRDVTSTRKPRDYMHFFRGRGCYSQVGRVGGGQRVSIGPGCQHHGVVVHEIGHAMGFWHEQSRPDRDNYVRILWNNIIPAMRFNFNRHSRSQINSHRVAYDYGSVMHYGAYAFTRYRGRKTIESKPAGRQLGQRNGLSASDKKQARLLYGCTTTTKPKPKPTVKPSGCLKDEQTHCQYWKSQGYCKHTTYKAYMQKNCCKTCKPVCRHVDNNSHRQHCPTWKSNGYCAQTRGNRYAKWMAKNCAKTCFC